MIIILFLIAIAILVGGIIWYRYDDCSFCAVAMLVFSATILIIIIIVGITLIGTCSMSATIGEKIKMYQEENQKIETAIKNIIENYQGYELETYNQFKTENIEMLIQLFPELKSDNLITKQIEIYNSNNYQIKKLKEDKIDIKLAKWWLYFGK